MAGGPDERVRDLFFLDQTAAGSPTEDGLVRLISGDLIAYVGGSAKSLTAGAGALPPATAVGQVLTSTDGANFTVQQPMVSSRGWLINAVGELLVVGT